MDPNARIQALEAAIRKHRDQRGDDRCWLDDQELYATLPEGAPQDGRPLLPPEEMLENCRRYIAHRHDPALPYAPSGLSELGEAMRRLISWMEASKARSVSIDHDNGYGAACWSVELHSARPGRGSGAKVVALEACFMEPAPSGEENKFLVFVTPRPDEDWAGLPATIEAALRRAEELKL